MKWSRSISRSMSSPNHSAGSMISRSRLKTRRDAGWSNGRKLKNVDGGFDGAPVSRFPFWNESGAQKFRPEQVYPATFGGGRAGQISKRFGGAILLSGRPNQRSWMKRSLLFALIIAGAVAAVAS